MEKWIKPAMSIIARPPRRLPIYLVFVGVAMILASILILSGPPSGISHFVLSESENLLRTKAHTPREQAANRTLGFQKMLVLSKSESWRTRGLRAAAKLTQLDFTIPPQPPVTDLTIETFRMMGPPGKATRPEIGSATAWLAHLDILRHVISSDLETALIVEDDVDWDTRVKDQMRLVSDNVRAFGRGYDKPEDRLVAADDYSTPYGTQWDVLWIGHCGSLGSNPSGAEHGGRAPLHYTDDTRPTTSEYSGWARDFVVNEVPEGKRAVHESRMTICTFAYAVSRKGAYNLLNLATGANGEAFDVSLHEYCRDKKLKCVAVSPQIMNHYEPSQKHGYVSLVKGADGKGTAKDESEFEGYMGSTENIVRSARCKALWGMSCLAK